ncbi:MAG: hypothetical protein IKI31_02510 [Treponema sp.]|nr:hypothetical protein [Treponema sp.]
MKGGENQKNSFDELVAGISSEERKFLLDKLKQNDTNVATRPLEVQREEFIDTLTLQNKLQSESLFYKFFLWLRSFFSKQPQSVIYNKDLIADIARKINKNYPGLIDFQKETLQSVFFEKLKELKNCADFFKQYINIINDNLGEFYVFLSTFIAPEIASKITTEADPYTVPLNRTITNELRLSLIRKLDAAIKDVSQESKRNMYLAVQNVEWIRQFTSLPFIHFLSQFTDVATTSNTCPFSNAQMDFPSFAKVLTNGTTISNEVMESVFLFLQRKMTKMVVFTSDNETAIKDFLKQSLSMFSIIHMFMSTVPLSAMGKVVFQDYDWQPDMFGGAEDWGIKFREQWKKVFDERWESWLRDRKKNQLVDVLKANFELNEFPDVPHRPWATLWGGVPFNCEMTAGFLSWFLENKYEDVINTLNIIMLEGVFLKQESRNKFSEAVNNFSMINNKVELFVESLSSRGSIGVAFSAIKNEHIRTVKNQQRVDSLMMNAETQIHSLAVSFCQQCRIIEEVFHGILDGSKDAKHDALQNLSTIRGHENAEFRENLLKTRETLKNMQRILADIEPLDLPRTLEFNSTTADAT